MFTNPSGARVEIPTGISSDDREPKSPKATRFNGVPKPSSRPLFHMRLVSMVDDTLKP